MSKTVVVGRLRAVYPDHIVLGGNLNVLIPRHFYMDGLEVGSTSLTVVVQEENDQAHGGERPENSGSGRPLDRSRWFWERPDPSVWTRGQR